jgi:hypothetical protein
MPCSDGEIHIFIFHCQYLFEFKYLNINLNLYVAKEHLVHLSKLMVSLTKLSDKLY